MKRNTSGLDYTLSVPLGAGAAGIPGNTAAGSLLDRLARTIDACGDRVVPHRLKQWRPLVQTSEGRLAFLEKDMAPKKSTNGKNGTGRKPAAVAAKAATTKTRKRTDPPTEMAASPGIAHDEIARRAYELWEERGRPLGSPEEDWNRAMEQLRARI